MTKEQKRSMLKYLQAYLRSPGSFVAILQNICGCERFRNILPFGKVFFGDGQQDLIRKKRISGAYAPAEFFAVDHQVQRTVQEPFRKNGRISLRQMNVNMRISAGKTTDAGRQDVGREKIAGADAVLNLLDGGAQRGLRYIQILRGFGKSPFCVNSASI